MPEYIIVPKRGKLTSIKADNIKLTNNWAIFCKRGKRGSSLLTGKFIRAYNRDYIKEIRITGGK